MAILLGTAEYLDGVTTETGDLAGIREDLSDVIYNISPTETPFMSNIGRTKATSVRHEWQIDSLAAVAVNASDQGKNFDTTTTNQIDGVDATVRKSNVTQISDKSVIISGTAEALLKAGRKSELAYQIAKKGKELKRDMEHNLCGVATGELVAVSGTGAKTRTLENWISTNKSHNGSGATATTPTTAVTDGTTRNITEDLVRAQIQAAWSAGGDPECMLVGPVNKQNISSQFAGIATLYRDANSGPATVVGASDMYISDFGELKVVPSRFSRDRTVSILQKDMWAIAYLRPFKIYELAKTGDAEKRLMNVEYALESRNEAASAKVADLTTTLI
jgi:hypothetical protein